MRGQQPYEMYLRRRRFMSWADVAVRCGFSNAASATTAARRYARHKGLPWPLSPAAASEVYGSMGQLAYDCAVENKGASWTEIAETVGTTSADSAYNNARRYAQRKGLRWPLGKRARTH